MNVHRRCSIGCLIILNLVSVLPLGGCAGLSQQRGIRATQPPLGSMPASWFWAWNRVDAADLTAHPDPMGANGVFVAPGLLLTVRHAYPLGRMEIDGIQTFVTSIVALGGPFGGAENDWVLIRTKVDSQPPYPALHTGPVPVGSRGFIVGHALTSPDVPVGAPGVFRFEVVKLPAKLDAVDRAISVRVTPADVMRAGFSGSPAYMINPETGRPELIGLVVGHTDVEFLGFTVGKGAVTIAPISKKVSGIIQKLPGDKEQVMHTPQAQSKSLHV